MSSELIRFGVIGTNSITEWFLKGAKQVEGFTLTAVYSRDEIRGKEFAEKHSAPHVFTDLEEMAKSDLLDAVYISSPNAFHGEQAILFLNNKKHVLCEKAFASNTKEVINMIEAARCNQVILMEAMKTTQLPNFKVVEDNLHRIGKIRKYFASYCKYSSRYDKYKEGIVLNAFKPELSNGALMDIGVYCIHPMINLFGKPKDLKANAIMLKSGVDGAGTILFNYEDMEGVVMYSKISNSLLPSEIQGEYGNILIEDISDFLKVKIVFKDGGEEDLSQYPIKDAFYCETEKFIDLIKKVDREDMLNSLQNSQWVMETMDEARRQIGLIYPGDKT